MSFTKKQLLPGENLVVLARQHPLILIKPALVHLIVLGIIVAVSYYSGKLWILSLYTVPLLYLIWKYFEWHKREYILTDRRVVRQEGVLSISSFDAPLDKINNVYHKQSFMGRLLNYGEVGLETASEEGTTVFDFLSSPLNFKNSIVRQRELYRTDSMPAGAAPRLSIPQLLEELAALRDRSIITESEFQAKKKALLEKI